MTPSEVTNILRQFNGWRRDFEDKFEQPDSREVSEAIDAAVEMIERLQARAEAAEKSDVESITMYWRAKAEIEALRAKVAEMEQQEPVSWADAFGEPFRQKSEIDGVASPLYALPGAKGE